MEISDLLWVAVGIVIGMYLLDHIYQQREQKTLAQLDADMRYDLEKYKNLSQSLLADVQYWRDRYHTLKKVKKDV